MALSGLGHKEVAPGIKTGGLITLHSGSPGVWRFPEHCGW